MSEIDISENSQPAYIEKTPEPVAPKPVITFKQAAKFVLPISDYKGQTLDRIAETDTGLKFLDWLGGARQESGQHTEIDDMLAAYLGDPTIQAELAEIYDKE